MNSKKTNEKINLNVEAIYNVSQGNLSNGAKKFKDYSYIYNIGGDNNGFSELVVNVASSCIYYLLINYVSYEPKLSFKININNIENNNIYYIDFSSQWSINSPLTYTIPLFLNNGNNILKFYGNGNNNAPYLGEFKVALPPITNDLSMGILENNAYIEDNTKFIEAIGGPKDGAVSVTVNITNKSMYNLVLSYICNVASRIFKIDINGIDSNNTYTVLSTSGFGLNNVQNFTIPINLNSGNNTIKFHGNGIDYGPKIGIISIKDITNMPTTIFSTFKTYKISSGIIGSGAIIDKTNDIVTNIGSKNDGYSIVKVLLDTFGDYLLRLNYINNNYLINFNYTNSKKILKIDINGIEDENIYNTTGYKTGILSVTLPLVTGINELKFHGNGIDMAPDLKDFTIELINDNSANAFTGVVENKATILKAGVITLLGGVDDGKYTMLYKTNILGWYDLYLTVDTSKGVIMVIDINEDNKGLIYNIPKYDSAKVYIIPIFLESKANSITFHGDYINYCPDILKIEIKLKKAIKDSIYSFADGLLENGAITNANKTVVEGIGGINNGSVILDVSINFAGLYDLDIVYMPNNIATPLKIDIIADGKINTSTVCILPGSYLNDGFKLPSFKVTMPLIKGLNNIKFYGNEINFVSNLNHLQISKAPIQNSNIFTKTYELLEGTFYNGVQGYDAVKGFIKGIGGNRKGRVSIDVEVPKPSEYTIEIKYLKINDNEKFLLTIDGINNEIYFNPPNTKSLKKEDVKSFITSIFLSEKSILSFEGMTGINAPFLGAFTLTEKKSPINKPYKISSINLYNGAKKYKGEDFITLIGGPKNGGVSLTIETINEGVYDLGFKYICEVNGRVLSVNINEKAYLNEYLVPATNDWEIINAKTFTIPLKLKSGINKVNIEGNGHDFSPIIGKFNLYVNTRMSMLIYETSKGTLKNGAKVNNYGLVTNIGGIKKGEVLIKVYVQKSGKYDLVLEYKPISESPILEIVINDYVYYMKREKEMETWSLVDMPTLKTNVYLLSGENIINFRGKKDDKGNISYAPFLGKFTLIGEDKSYDVTKNLSKGIYDVSKGKLENGAQVFQGFVIDIGGFLGGTVTVTVNVERDGKYFMIINYIAVDTEKSYLMFDINGEENGNIYPFSKTDCLFEQEEVEIKLIKGDNLIRFYGIKNKLAPRLSTISIKALNE